MTRRRPDPASCTPWSRAPLRRWPWCDEKRILLAWSLFLPVLSHTIAAEPQRDPADHWALNLDTGMLCDLGSRATPLDYTFLPVVLTLKSGAVMRRAFGDGELVVRGRFSLLAEPIVEGPERYFIGVAVAPSIEWWSRARAFSTFFSIGGGVGVMDSKGYEIPGAQGQDFNLNWFMHGGVRYRVSDRLSAAVGLYFQHISNGGQDPVNPGVDALGPTLGMGWRF